MLAGVFAKARTPQEEELLSKVKSMAIRARDEAGNLTGHPAYLASLLTTDIPVCYEEASASTMPMKMATSIECWLIDQLLPYARNARTHSDEQVAQIAASIKEFGFVNPILVGPDRVIIAGHGRLLAARRLGILTHQIADHP